MAHLPLDEDVLVSNAIARIDGNEVVDVPGQPLKPVHVIRHRDEIRRLEEDDLGIPEFDRVAPRPLGNSTEGKPGTRKGRFGKQQRTRFGGRRG